MSDSPKIARQNAVSVSVELSAVDVERLDAWIFRQPEPRPMRPEAIRRFVKRALAADGAGANKSLSDAALDTEIAEHEAKIAKIPAHEEPSPEAALATMDRAIAENELVRLKNKRVARRKADK